MNSIEAKAVLDAMTGPVSPDHPPTIPQLTEWAERVVAQVPKADLHGVLFGVWSYPSHHMGDAGFTVQFAERFWPATQDTLRVKLERRELRAGDPLYAHGLKSVSLDDYPTQAAFFAAVREHPSYHFACGYPFDRVDICATEPRYEPKE
jgi:hypothetical protein